MRFARHHSTLAAVTLGLLAFCAPALMASQNAANWAVMVATNASVQHGETGAATPVTVGGMVVEGDQLTTGAGGALVLSRGEDLVTMAENSRITIVDPQPSATTLIDQPYGNVQYHVTKGPAPHFEVDSPLLATIVKGTTFSVSASDSGNSVSVSEGRVEARNRATGASSPVGAGQMGSVAGNGKDVSVGAAPANAAGAANSGNANANSAGSNKGGKGGGKGGGRGEGGGHGGNSNGSANGNGANNAKKNGDGNGNGNGHGNGHGNGGN